MVLGCLLPVHSIFWMAGVAVWPMQPYLHFTSSCLPPLLAASLLPPPSPAALHLQACSDGSFIIPLGLCAPYAWRLVQCLRVYLDTGARPQLFNALKYSTAFPVGSCSTGGEAHLPALDKLLGAAHTPGSSCLCCKARTGMQAEIITLLASQQVCTANTEPPLYCPCCWLQVILLSAVKSHVAPDMWRHTFKPLWLAAAFLNSAYSFFWDVERDWEISWFSQMGEHAVKQRQRSAPASKARCWVGLACTLA